MTVSHKRAQPEPPQQAGRTTRLAPSPTGALHLGNARTFLVNWALARQAGWRIVLRLEDLDGPRVKPEASEQAIDVLQWLGLDWDEGPIWQSHDLTPYHDALRKLQHQGLIYPCRCTRREIERAQSAPHEDEHELRYPGTCRPGEGDEVTIGADTGPHLHRGSTSGAPGTSSSHAARAPRRPRLGARSAIAWRVQIPDEPITFYDQFHGKQTINVQQQVGDFIVATKQGLPAYQLAVVVDDARQGVTDVVRGDDLIRSTARQLWLYDLLELGQPPAYLHLPLVLGPDGRRLAKRHGDTRLSSYREQGVSAERVVGLLAHWCGLTAEPTAMSAAEFRDRFDLAKLPRTPVTLTEEDEAWLTGL